MSDHFSGWTSYHHKQQWLSHWSYQNVVTGAPFGFTGYYYFPDHLVIDGDGDHLHHHHLYHHCQPLKGFTKLQPPTTNLRRIRRWGHGGAKAYFRFHGGIGDGIACRNTKDNTAARPLQLFDALHPIHFQITADGGFVKIPVTGPPVLPVEASGGTGVFLPVYQKRIRASKGMHVRGKDWQQCRGGRMKQQEYVSKRFVGDDAVEKIERKNIEEISVESLLPSEWTY
ncbi:hypothetical protein E3N88_32895 [Mikania micrantha]|uniref:Uncharacterized protein n=1 Tax=Mikania micrantha TaxID=192012 RepID=A0A5N6M9P0_9ASTR|nr:hypothetical protein E3N88_32895 [Mikania micrantha]